MKFKERIQKICLKTELSFKKICSKISNQNKFWQNFGSRKIWVKRGFSLKKFEYQRIWSKKIGLKKLFGPKKSDKKKILVKKIFGSHGPIFKVWSELGYSIRFKLGQMLHGQMFMGQMFSKQLTTHTDGLIIEFG